MARGWSVDAEGSLPDADLLTFEFGLFQVGAFSGSLLTKEAFFKIHP
jgi:hypothetical protein